MAEKLVAAGLGQDRNKVVALVAVAVVRTASTWLGVTVALTRKAALRAAGTWPEARMSWNWENVAATMGRRRGGP